MVVARRGADAIRLEDGRVLVAGGDDHGSLSSADLYDPTSNSWRVTGSMTVPHGGATGTLLGDGRVLIAGHSYIGDVYASSTGTWKRDRLSGVQRPPGECGGAPSQRHGARGRWRCEHV